jgi:deoxyxylulose-5-phosphate synthase
VLNEKGTRAGVILLEVLKPYDVTLDNILSLIPDNTHSVLFLEEEIRCGGMGVCICDEMSKRGIDGIKTKILAVDDSFVTDRKPDECIYTSAGIDVDSICAAVCELKK